MEFNLKAQSYDVHAVVQAALAEWGSEWIKTLPPESRIMELGAGTGVFTQHLIPWFTRIEASDRAENMVLIGRRKFPVVHWSLQNAWALNAVSRWDCLCSSGLLQWASDVMPTLENWRCALKSGGRVYANIFVKGTLNELYSLYPEAAPLQFQAAEWWVNAFKTAGFTSVRYAVWKRRFFYPTPVAFFRSLHDTGAFAPRKTPFSVMKKVLEAYSRQFSAFGKCYATWNFMRIEAVKASAAR